MMAYPWGPRTTLLFFPFLQKWWALTVVHRHLLHESIVDGAVPEQEGCGRNGETVSQRHSQVSSTVGDTDNQHEQASQEVEGQGAQQCQPDVVQETDSCLVCFWDLCRDGPIFPS